MTSPDHSASSYVFLGILRHLFLTGGEPSGALCTWTATSKGAKRAYEEALEADPKTRSPQQPRFPPRPRGEARRGRGPLPARH